MAGWAECAVLPLPPSGWRTYWSSRRHGCRSAHMGRGPRRAQSVGHEEARCGSDVLVFAPEHPEIQRYSPLDFELALDFCATGVLGREHADHADAPVARAVSMRPFIGSVTGDVLRYLRTGVEAGMAVPDAVDTAVTCIRVLCDECSRRVRAIHGRLDRTEGRSGARKCAGARDMDLGLAGWCRRLDSSLSLLASSTLPRSLLHG